MQVSVFDCFSTGLRKYRVVILALTIIFGLFFGAFSAMAAGDELFLMMRTVPQRSVSIVGSLAVSALPFFVFYIAVSSGRTWLLFVICFFKAFSWSFCSCLTAFAFGNAGWLVQILFLFSDTVTLPFLFFFAIRYISGERRMGQLDLFAYMSISAVVGFIDFCYVSPFLAMIL